MIQMIIQGVIESGMDLSTYETLQQTASLKFSVKCMNSLQKVVSVKCVAYNQLALKIYSEYKQDDVVTMIATLSYGEKGYQATVFSIEPSNITVLPHKKFLYNEEYVSADREYTIDDVKSYLKLK